MQKFIFLAVLFLLINNLSAQNKYAASKNPQNDTVNSSSNKITRIQIGVGGVFSSLNFFRNDLAKRSYPGVSARIYYQPLKYLRILVDYTQIQPVSLRPTWLNVHNSYLDIDANFLFNFNDSKFFGYFILGASSQHWNGFYTGIDDYNNRGVRVPNTNFKTTYYGGNMGFGAEDRIISRLDLYIEIRFRVIDTDIGIGLSDVSYGGGIKYSVIDRYPGKIYKKPSKHFRWIKKEI